MVVTNSVLIPQLSKSSLMINIIRKIPWDSLFLLLLTYINIGWATCQLRSYSLNWLLVVIAILILTSCFNAPWRRISGFLHFLLRSNLRYFGVTLLGAFLLFFVLARFRMFLDILVIVATIILVRLDLQTLGYREKLAFRFILFISLLGLVSGFMLHFLFVKYW